MKYTKEQIEESIVNWSSYMLKNNLATEDEVKDMLNEGLFRRAVDAVKRFGARAEEIAHAINWAPQKIYDIICKKNAGVEKLIEAMEKMRKNGATFDGIKMYAVLGAETYPILRFAVINHKSTLVLIVDKTAKNTNPLTLNDLKDFLVSNKIRLTTFIDSIVCAEQKNAEKMIAESKLSDYIEKNKLSKADALKPDVIKHIKRNITKKNDEDTKSMIEKYFSKKSTSKGSTKSSGKKTTKAKAKTKSKTSKKTAGARKKTLNKKAPASKTPTSKSAPKREISSELSSEPMDKSKEAPTFKGGDDSEASSKETTPQIQKDALNMFDNKLLDVKGQGDSIGFIFSKSKAEIALDKKEAYAFS